MMRKKRIAILGSTGSIGLSTLDVIRHHKDRFEAVLLTAYNNVKLLRDQVREFHPGQVAISHEKLNELHKGLPGAVKLFDVERDLPELVAQKGIDVVVIAMTGAQALDPFLSAAKAGKMIAPANKEAIVVAGEIIMGLAKRSGARIIPVDSEQSAIFQALEGHRRQDAVKVHLTASGGPLRNVPASRLSRITVEQVLRHPRWRMGAKITVDSATLLNKGFEVIETQRLFGFTPDEIDVVVHPEAIIHSMVGYRDGSVIAQLSVTDMRLPIQYALTYPERMRTGTKGLDFAAIQSLTFYRPDVKKFPLLGLAYYAAREGGTVPAVLNAVDEIAVDAFLRKDIGLLMIHRVVEKVLRSHRKVGDPSLEDIKEADLWARSKARAYIRAWS
jgi:1-deoxy-D-xylulose-5-phosphate reductoisomerase